MAFCGLRIVVNGIAATSDVFCAQKAVTTETKSHAGGVPITVDEYSELKHSLKESEMQMQRLLHSNTRLGEEVAPVSYTHLTLPTKRIV